MSSNTPAAAAADEAKGCVRPREDEEEERNLLDDIEEFQADTPLQTELLKRLPVFYDIITKRFDFTIDNMFFKGSLKTLMNCLEIGRDDAEKNTIFKRSEKVYATLTALQPLYQAAQEERIPVTYYQAAFSIFWGRIAQEVQAISMLELHFQLNHVEFRDEVLLFVPGKGVFIFPEKIDILNPPITVPSNKITDVIVRRLDSHVLADFPRIRCEAFCMIGFSF